jgi:hypothetical protein
MTTPISPTTLAFEEYAQGEVPLPSWNEGSTKQSIVNFVRGVTTAGGSHFVKPEDRIAVFDNDGTLWSEQPMPFQFAFVIDRLKEIAPPASRMERQATHGGCSGGRHGNCCCRRPTRSSRTCEGYSRWHDHRRVLKACERLDRNRQASKIESSLHAAKQPHSFKLPQ